MELNQLSTAPAHEAGAELRVKDQFGKATDFYITLQGEDSKAFRAAKKRQTRQWLEAVRTKSADEVDDSQMDRELCADCIVSWKGLLSDGKEVECNRKEILDLFDVAPYLVGQILEFIVDRRNFTKG